MNPRESDPTGAFTSGGGAGLENAGPEDDADVRREGSSGRPQDQADGVTPGVDEAERETITSGTAATSEVADRDAQDEAESRGDGTPRHR